MDGERSVVMRFALWHCECQIVKITGVWFLEISGVLRH